MYLETIIYRHESVHKISITILRASYTIWYVTYMQRQSMFRNRYPVLLSVNIYRYRVQIRIDKIAGSIQEEFL